MGEDADADGSTAARSDAGDPGFDEAALYGVVRRAVEDAILNAVGTLLLVGIGLFFVVGAGQALVRGDAPAEYAVGVSPLGFGLYLVAATLELIPSIWDVLRR